MPTLPSKISGPLTVVGDVHGQTDLLASLIARLQARADFTDRWLVFLGDFVDRGPNPRAALDAVLALRQHHPKFAAVMGNHDLALVAALGLVPTSDERNWPARYLASYNAASTFASYGVPFGDLPALAAALPPAHKQFLAGLPWCVEHPEYLIVHAGLLSNVPFAKQLHALRRRDFTLNRPAWLCDRRLARTPIPADCPLTVISGHVQVEQVTFSERRILMDTTGGFGGELSAVLLPERLVLTSGPFISDAASSNPGNEPGSSNSTGENS